MKHAAKNDADSSDNRKQSKIFLRWLKDMQILLSRTQAGAGRTGKQKQEKTSRNHLQDF